MKKRKGFVSNSSSSSFVVGVKGNLTKVALMKAFKVDKKSPFYPLACDMASFIKNYTEKFSKKNYMRENDYEDEDELNNIEKMIFNKGWNLYSGEASDEGRGSDDNAEITLCSMELDYEDDDIILHKHAYY